MSRLDLSLLTSAGAESSKGKREFKSAYLKAQEFNANYREDGGYGEEEEKAQINRLDKVLELAGLWLTGKSAKQECETISRAQATKNAARWQALAGLCEQCSAALIGMGYRPLFGHWNANPLDDGIEHANYWLERLDPQHRGASALKERYNTWARLSPSHKHFGKTFFEYVDTDISAKYLPKVRYDKGVESSKAEERRKIRRESLVKIEGGKLHRVNSDGSIKELYDTTRGMKTEFAGEGFAIFVWDFKKRIFSHQHIANSLHHSTARGGRPVRCAGEFRTDGRGKIVMITSKTGHYQTTPTEFRTFLSFLETSNAIADNAICVPDTSGQTPGSWTMFAARPWAGGTLRPKSKSDVDALLPALKTELKSRNFYNRLA